MNNVAVIGDRASVYGFAALGLDTYFITDAVEAVRQIKKLRANGCKVIYITEQLAESIGEELWEINEGELPSIVPIPGIYGNSGIGMKRVRESVIRAVGSDIV